MLSLPLNFDNTLLYTPPMKIIACGEHNENLDRNP